MPAAFPPLTLTVENLACARGGAGVFEGLSFAVKPGQAIAVTGANGSGKTSLLRIVGGLMKAAGGRVRLEAAGGEAPDPATASHYLGHLLGLEEGRSARANLAFAAALLGGPQPDEGLLARVGLGALAHAPVRQFSAGERKRLALARLAVSPRPLWLLDEPGSALDAQGTALLGALASEHLAGGGLILAATHGALPFPVGGELRLAAPGGGAP